MGRYRVPFDFAEGRLFDCAFFAALRGLQYREAQLRQY